MFSLEVENLVEKKSLESLCASSWTSLATFILLSSQKATNSDSHGHWSELSFILRNNRPDFLPISPITTRVFGYSNVAAPVDVLCSVSAPTISLVPLPSNSVGSFVPQFSFKLPRSAIVL